MKLNLEKSFTYYYKTNLICDKAFMSNLLQKRKMYCIRIIHMKEPPHKDRPFCDKGNNKKSVAKRWKAVSFHKRHQKSESPDQHNMNVQYYYQNDRKITTWITVSSIKLCTIFIFWTKTIFALLLIRTWVFLQIFF